MFLPWFLFRMVSYGITCFIRNWAIQIRYIAGLGNWKSFLKQCVGCYVFPRSKWSSYFSFKRNVTKVSFSCSICSSCFLFRTCVTWYSKRLAGITWYLFLHGSKKVSQSGIMIPTWYHSQPGYSESTRDTNGYKPGDDTKNRKKPIRKNGPEENSILFGATNRQKLCKRVQKGPGFWPTKTQALLWYGVNACFLLADKKDGHGEMRMKWYERNKMKQPAWQ